MLNLFIFRRDLRIVDNTTLIKMLKDNKSLIPIFIFTPEQIDSKKNKYFSNNSVQFMIESLLELNKELKKFKSKIYFFYGDNIEVLNQINKTTPISSIGFNLDYSPYAIKRDTEIKNFCKKNNILLYSEEDYSLYPIMDETTWSKSGKPYTVFTPFKKNLYNNHKVRNPDKFNKFKFKKEEKLKQVKTYLKTKKINNFYVENDNINVNGGRKNALKILKNLTNWKKYNTSRNCMEYKTTFLSAYLHFNVVSIRETYHKMVEKLGKNNLLIDEIHWRDFYMNISYNFPQVLAGMVSKKSSSFKDKYDNIKWSKSKKKLQSWMDGKTGYPIVDACMNQMNITGYMHNRGRMIVASFLTKHLLIDWREGEKYFAKKLVDYDCHSNNGGWQWSSGSGTDAQPYFRIFNPWTQGKKFDPDCIYIKKWLPIFDDVPAKDIHKWEDLNIRKKYNLKYPHPIVDHKEARELILKTYKKALN